MLWEIDDKIFSILKNLNAFLTYFSAPEIGINLLMESRELLEY